MRTAMMLSRAQRTAFKKKRAAKRAARLDAKVDSVAKGLTVPQLRDLCEQYRLKTTGVRATLRKRLRVHFQNGKLRDTRRASALVVVLALALGGCVGVGADGLSAEPVAAASDVQNEAAARAAGDDLVRKEAAAEDGKVRSDLSQALQEVRAGLDPTEALAAARAEAEARAEASLRASEKRAAAEREALERSFGERLGNIPAAATDVVRDYGAPGAFSLLAMFLLNFLRNRARTRRGEPIGVPPPKSLA